MKTVFVPSWRAWLAAAFIASLPFAAQAANMAPIQLTGFNWDVVIENTVSGPPYTGYAFELNPGENLCFYQSGLSNKSYGLPVSGNFTSALGDGTVFQLQPYTANNALVLSTDTGVSMAALTLVSPSYYSRLAILANSASANAASAGALILTFTDGSTFVTSYNAPDWFNNTNYALQGFERINLTTGATSGATTNPRFYQTTLDLNALLGASNKPISSLTFTQASGAKSTGIYAVSGEWTPTPALIVSNPASLTVSESLPATFNAKVGGSPSPTVQWYRNGGLISGATNLTYSIPAASMADDGAGFRIVAANVVSNVNYSATSSVASLTVMRDTNPPVLLGAVSLGLSQVQVRLSERTTPATATNLSNYAIAGTNGPVSISNAALDATGSNVVLSVAALTDRATYTLTVNNLADLSAAHNVIAANTQTNFIASIYIPAGIGSPLLSGGLVPAGNGFNVTGAGSGLGGTADQFQFGYVQQNGNFDFKVRLDSITLADAWSEAGLMARESLDAGARAASVLATPSISGAFFQSRVTTNGSAVTTGSFPVNYPNTWLRLARAGDDFTGYASFDGSNWAPLGTVNVAMPASVYFGFVASSYSTGQLATAVFRDLSAVTNVGSGSIPTIEFPGQCSRRTPLAITEIMYHPTNTALEFVELFNSRGESQDLSGYQLDGSIRYTFPAGTTLPGGGFLVVARSPADLQAAYGITGVFGPFTNSLPNDKGTVTLISQSGGVGLQVDYTDQAPWPVAADGTGHSLVLAHASYGENNPLGWAISDAVGGSPGRADPFTPDPLRNVCINEFLAHTDPPDEDYIELYNHSTQPVDISGCILTDDPATNKFLVGPDTSIPAHGFIHFTESTLNFALSAAGETLYFKNAAQTRVIDAVQFEGQENGVATGRYPDGGDQLYRLNSKTPGNSNAVIRVSNVVLNELMYHPISEDDDDQYIEIFNRGAQTVNLGGWTLADAVSFTFPSNTLLAPGGYLVVARNAARLLTNYPSLNANNTVGDFSGKLSGKGERLVLTMPDTIVSTNGSGVVSTNLIHIAMDEVTYGTGGRWPQWSDGGGSSLELADPRSNHRLPSNWADSDETHKAPWTLVSATGTIDNGSTSSADQLQLVMQGAGECLVDNVEVVTPTGTNIVTNSTFEVDASSWTAEGTESQSSLDTSEGYNSTKCYHIRAVDRGDNQVNRIRTPLPSAYLPSGTTNVTIRAAVRWLKGNPGLLLRLRGNWLECAGEMTLPVRPGTPGTVNSRYTNNAPPAITATQHSPVLPAANQNILVTAQAQDPDGVAAVTLFYRLDPSTSYSTLAMNDSGTSGDLVAGDGVFSAAIPGQTNGTTIAFYLQATDRFAPAASAYFPNNAPARECLVRVGELQPTGNFPVYRIWMTQATLSTWSSRYELNNTPFDVTFVVGDQRVIYNSQALYAGSPYIAPSYSSPTVGRCGYTVTVPADDLFLGETDLVLDWPGGHGNESTALQEQMGYWIAEQLNLPFSYRYTIRLHVNGVTDDARRAVFEANQQPAKGFIDQWSPAQTEGQFFKIDRAFEFSDGNSLIAAPEPRLQNFTTTGGAKKREKYRWTWMYRSANRVNDYTNIFALVDALNAASPEPYTSATFGQVDVEQWMRTFAVEHIIVNFDAYGHEIGKNMYSFLPKGGKWALYMCDLDWLMLAAQNHGYYASSAPLFNSEDPTITRMYGHPPFLRAYWRAVQDAVNGPLDPANYGPVMDAKYKSLVANGVKYCDNQVLTDPTAVKVWFSQRRAFLQSQLAAVTPPFAVSPSVTTTNGTAIVTGTASIEAKTISVNGAPWPVTWTSVTGWTAIVSLKTGTNLFSVVGLDAQDQVLAGSSNTVAVIYTNTVPSPAGLLAINEIMSNPRLPDAEYVELFNSSTNFAVDLSGWNLNGLSYTFPAGSIISPLGYLLLAKDRVAFDIAYGPSLSVFDTFAGNLQLNGETLSLLQPAPGGLPETVIDRVRYEPTQPWPAAAAGTSLQLVDRARDHARVGNWAAGRTNPSPAANWVYAWTNITATSSRLYLYVINSGGDLYLDDMKLVAGSLPEAGTNLLRAGDFETALGTNWNLAGNFTASALSTAIKHLGNSSLHMIASAAGSGSGNSIYQDISPALTTSATYTLSFWYLQNTNAVVPPFVARLSGASVLPTFYPSAAPPVAASPFTPGASNSVAATLPAFPTIWLNELQAENLTGPTDNFGERDSWLEIYNPGTNPVSLAGLYLGTNYASPTLWAFPPNASLDAGQFLLVWADGQPQQSSSNSFHTPFRLTPGSGTVALTRFVSNALQLVDYLTYTNLTPNYSYGDVPDAQPFYRQAMYSPTPLATNNASLPPINVWINEWMAENTTYLVDPATGKCEDWFELYNPSDTAAELGGYYLTDALTNAFQFQIPTGFTVPPHGFLLVWADGKSSANTNPAAALHVSFKLNKDSESIGLFAPDGSAIDALSFGLQAANVSEGRFPDANSFRLFMPTPSPAAPNILPPADSAPAISQTSVQPGGQVTLTFSTSPGHSYRVQFKDTLDAPGWSPLTGALFSTGQQLTVIDPGPLPTRRYYRIAQLD